MSLRVTRGRPLFYRRLERWHLDSINAALRLASPTNDEQTALWEALNDKYTQYERQFEKLIHVNTDTEPAVKRLHGAVTKFRNEIVTKSKRLNFNVPLPSSLWQHLSRVPDESSAFASESYVPEQITSDHGLPRRLAGPAGALSYQGHVPRHSQSLTFNPSSFAPILEESAPVALGSPHRPRPAAQAFHAANPSISSSFSESHHAAQPSHGHSFSITSAQTFGHAQQALPTARHSAESQSSRSSGSTGDSYSAYIESSIRQKYPAWTDAQVAQAVQQYELASQQQGHSSRFQ